MQREGYISIDHRASPGLPEDLARQRGFDPMQVGEGRLFESAMQTCAHCKTAVIKNPGRLRAREHCFKCSHYICDGCAAATRHPDYIHSPFDKIVDLTMKLGSPPKLLLTR